MATAVYSDNKILSQGLMNNCGKAKGHGHIIMMAVPKQGTYTDGRKLVIGNIFTKATSYNKVENS
ncbi:MAG: hypothetical protein IPP29_02975 [Bacteroidetes bacterium]|nr:hypothetical protein [Bacteroidota bacterium]